jgi:hypothetical protein
MAITIVTRAGKGAALNATEFDANFNNIAAAVENITTGHDHDGVNSKKVVAANIVNTPAGDIVAITVQAALNELDTEKVPKVTGRSLVANTEIAKIHANTLDHSNASDHAVGASIASSISDGDLTHSPDGNSVFDALALKATLELYPIHEETELCGVD